MHKKELSFQSDEKCCCDGSLVINPRYTNICDSFLFHCIWRNLSSEGGIWCFLTWSTIWCMNFNSASFLRTAKWKAALDSKIFLEAFNKLLIAKLHAYKFGKSPFKILWSYLTKCWQREKIDTAFSSWRGDDRIWETSNTEFLGEVIENQLKSNRHVCNLCSKANNKLTVLTRMIKYLDPQKRKVAFFKSSFKYCSLVWMFHSHPLNKRINRLHERALRVIYNDYNETLEELLHVNRSCTIHENNIQQLVIEMFKVKNGLGSKDFESIFLIKKSSQNLKTAKNQSWIFLINFNTIVRPDHLELFSLGN